MAHETMNPATATPGTWDQMRGRGRRTETINVGNWCMTTVDPGFAYATSLMRDLGAGRTLTILVGGEQHDDVQTITVVVLDDNSTGGAVPELEVLPPGDDPIPPTQVEDDMDRAVEIVYHDRKGFDRAVLLACKAYGVELPTVAIVERAFLEGGK